MSFGSHSSVKQDPFLTGLAINNLNSADKLLGQGPVTTLPPEMASNVNLPDALTGASSSQHLLPKFLQMSTKNPIFATPSQDIAQNYGNKLFDYSVKPQLGSAAIGSWLGGNLGNSGESTFGANYLSNLEASGRIQSFMGGQQYYDDLLNNTLNERNNYFGNEVQSGLQSQMFNQQQKMAGLGMLNNFNLDAAGLYNNVANSAINWNNTKSQMQMQQQAAQGANMAGLVTGAGGLLGGFLGLGSGGGGKPSWLGGGIGSGGSGGSGGGFNWGGAGGLAPTSLATPHGFMPGGF